MKPVLIGAAITGAMLLGWEVGEWMQARFGLAGSFVSWALIAGSAFGVVAWQRGRG